jgi:hypothetical protein
VSEYRACICGDCRRCKKRAYDRTRSKAKSDLVRQRRAADPEYAAKRREDARRLRQANVERVRQQEREREERRAAKRRAYAREYGKSSREKKIAQRRVALAIERGDLSRQPCEECSSVRHVQAHHEDYAKPLEVRWLCASCHGLLHAQERREAS